MSVVRRSLAAVAVVATALAVLSPGASADTSAPSIGKPHVALPKAPTVARGLIIKTTTSAPSKSLLKSADSAIGSDANVVRSKALTAKISTVDFDQVVSESAAAKAANQVAKRSDVVWAVPNTRRQVTSSPPVTVNDPHFSGQRNVWDSTASRGGYSIKAPSMWRKTTGSSDVVVAVVDSGILNDHPDIHNQLVPGYDMVSADDPDAVTPTYYSANDLDGRDSDPSDPGDWATKSLCGYAEPSSWHGTFVAGMIAAEANNAQGITGIAPGVKIEPVRALGRCGGWDSDIIAGIVWASGGNVADVPANEHPANVINLSLGHTYGTSSTQRALKNAACQEYGDAEQVAHDNGAVVIAAAGNDGGDANMAVPASCPGYLSVGATSLRGFSSWYSNIGSSVDLVAPGGDTLAEGSKDSVLSLVNSGAKIPTPGRSTYARYEGTSMAAPEVSAAAALLYSIGETDPYDVAHTLVASVSHFHSRSSSYAKKKIRIGTHTYYFDLNCSGHHWCGSGVLDLSRMQVPITAPTIAGGSDPIIGEPLSVAQGKWVSTPTKFRYAWFRSGTTAPVGTGSTYTPTHADVGSALTVRVEPFDEAFASFTTTSPPTAQVPDGPNVSLNSDWGVGTYGQTYTIGVGVSPSGTTPVDDGTVEVRRGSTVLVSGTTVDGKVSMVIPGDAWIAGTNSIRIAYLGAGSTPPASSAAENVLVNRAVAKVSGTLPSSWHASSHAKYKVTVTVNGLTGPTGTIRVYDGEKRLLTTSLYKSEGGKKTITLPRLKKGKHLIGFKFESPTIWKASAARHHVTVK